MKINEITFSEIVDVYDTHGPYDREVEVLGYDKNGIEYSAVGMESCGELVDVYEETILEVDSEPYIPEGSGWDVDVDEDGPFITISKDVPDEVWEPEYLNDR